MTIRSGVIGAVGVAAAVAAGVVFSRPGSAPLPDLPPAVIASPQRPEPASAPASQRQRYDPPAQAFSSKPAVPPPSSASTAMPPVPQAPGMPTQPPAAVPAAEPPVTPPVADAAVAQAATAAKTKPEPSSLTVEKDSVIGIRIDQAISSGTSRVDDKVTARVSRDVLVDGRTAIAAGTKLEGAITLVDRTTGRLGLRFHTLVLNDDKRLPIQTDAIVRLADPQTGPGSVLSSRAIGDALAKGPRQNAAPGRMTIAPQPVAPPRLDARIPAGGPLTVKLTAAITIAIERE